jgi:hypothetical protein
MATTRSAPFQSIRLSPIPTTLTITSSSPGTGIWLSRISISKLDSHYIRANSDLWATTTLIFSLIYYENYLRFDQLVYSMLGGPRKVRFTSRLVSTLIHKTKNFPLFGWG